MNPALQRVDGRQQLRREAVAIASATFAVTLAAIAGLWITSTASIKENYRHYLIGLAVTASHLVDPELHAAIHQPNQLNDASYLRAVEPLRRIRAGTPDVRHVYTMVRDAEKVRFVLDAADPGDKDGDGIEDQAGVWEVYQDREPAMLEALGTATTSGIAAATDRPFSDKWGAFMTGWAPLRDSDGRQYGAVGVDVDAAVYLARLQAARVWALLGLLPATLLTGVLTLGFFRIRLRYLLISQRAAQAAEALAIERERLSSIIDATHVGTWEMPLTTPTRDAQIVVDQHCAAMLGYAPHELNPLSLDRLASLFVHQEDRDAARAAFETALCREENLLEIVLRLRHAKGHWIWVEIRGRLLNRDAHGGPQRMVGTQMDVSARKATEIEFATSERRFRSLFELSPVGICLVDMQSGQFLQVNDSLVASTGYCREELLTRSYRELTPLRWETFEREQLSVLEHSTHFGTYEKEYQRKDGSCYPVLVSGTRLKDAAGRDLIWAIVQDISERKAMESKLADAARRDKLTGLVNRVVFMEELQAAVDRVRSGRQARLAVLFLDFDRFKLINDAMGHGAGDQLLKGIAARLQNTLRRSSRQGSVDRSVVARFGGDEFLVLLNDLDDCVAAERVANRLLEVLAQKYSVMDREIYSTASVGIVVSEQSCEDADSILRNADVAMYEAKRSGRACAVVFNETMRVQLTRSIMIETGLRRALGSNELSVVYQPIVDLDRGHTTSVEALVRWNHPELGPISPAEFIPVAEESGLIVPLGQWVLEQACRALARWRSRFPLTAPATMSVNISRAELAQGERLLARVRDALRDSGLPSDCLQLEVTEREVMRNPEVTKQLMLALRNMGVRLAMDDFGTGTSSLGCLRDYPFDVIKIDRAFIDDVPASADVMALIHATITLVKNLGKKSVAEGIERPEQLAVLQSLGCHYGQGYIFSKPVPEAELLARLANEPASDEAVDRALTRAVGSMPAVLQANS
ncbi:putative bifunctional diguanylate cyclase/phosphodiesterase [Steroidobacter sp.]|uniref:putative bifunctional diguanylate cyclase/phosphodiesterase n=1 Tax=Steroidobacter sp. TaxID=1978227 RepID=UPI001A47B480|nr:GGDEF domain-containing phosphodiesterase [Steroidobacter sp.]MBL8270745.1 EAL domain-containing protein [Steroidobacter sp.]